MSTQATLVVDGNRATITFETERGLNVASVPFLERLEPLLDDLASKPDVRAVQIRGAGKVFLAGADIKAMSGYDGPQARAMAELGTRVFDKLATLPQITIACLHGAALGGGSELSLACDYRLALPGTKLGQPEVLLGLICGWGGTYRLPKLIGPHAARQLLLSGNTVSAEEALELGWIDEIVESEAHFGEVASRLIAPFLKAGPAAIAATKRALHHGDEVNEFAKCFEQAEARDGLQAFLEKRTAPWVPAADQ